MRYGSLATPWWHQYNVAAGDVGRMVEGTGWSLQRQLIDGDDHAALLRATPS